MSEAIVITKAEYDDLKHDSKFLTCLFSYGVDNWEGYREAKRDFYEGKSDE